MRHSDSPGWIQQPTTHNHEIGVHLIIISGPPCSGKSTHVDEHKGENDVVVDLDRLCVALGSSHSHEHPPDIKSVALAVRTNLIDSLLHRAYGQVWVIDSNPSPDAIQRYRSAGAIFRVLDPGEMECSARAHERTLVRETQRAIHAWYLDPPDLPR